MHIVNDIIQSLLFLFLEIYHYSARKHNRKDIRYKEQTFYVQSEIFTQAHMALDIQANMHDALH
jgi:hypothetical protein